MGLIHVRSWTTRGLAPDRGPTSPFVYSESRTVDPTTQGVPHDQIHPTIGAVPTFSPFRRTSSTVTRPRPPYSFSVGRTVTPPSLPSLLPLTLQSPVTNVRERSVRPCPGKLLDSPLVLKTGPDLSVSHNFSDPTGEKPPHPLRRVLSTENTMRLHNREDVGL